MREPTPYAGPGPGGRQRRANVLGLIVPSVANPFWGVFARELEAEATRAGYQLQLCNGERDPAREQRYLRQLLSEGHRGIVLCSSPLDLASLVPFIRRGAVVVTADRVAVADDPPGTMNVSVDNASGQQLAVAHLAGLGHRRIAFVTASIPAVSLVDRLAGFRAAAGHVGLAPGEITVWPSRGRIPFGDTSLVELGRLAAHELLAGRPEDPTAFVCVNDMCALGVCRGALELGYGIPGDVSVVGFDDILLAGLARPALTTIRQPMRQIAARAFRLLREGLDDAGPPRTRTELLLPELVVRESTAAPRAS
ncbi:LacI family DNA-binding transcriptional regulator [Amycolatopsis sp. Hca4]|uniref:LacI family DNA-binding transcriptional regulator n=1 Tax=Amycolatopsis sp. Hca4 TaxID=2742131 RepID=UPI0015919221|nr:substrate-binding domain-containing protein [Amycolatopsis sp. Hca4]QKV73926.1 substrate-binding domain-containing protein [Amycolatopsis sp. Hca4]